MIVDAHVHCYDPERPQGIPHPPRCNTLLYRPMLPRHLKAVARVAGVSGAVLIECSPWIEDNQWALDLAAAEPFLLAVVGHLNPAADNFATLLHRFAADPLFRGIRVRPLDLNHARTVPNLSLLAEVGRTLDVLVTSKDLPAIAALAAAVPNLRIMIDHLASVRIGDRADEANWSAGMQLFSKLPNVYCKISAFMEGSTTQPPPTESRFYAGIFSKAEDIFGSNRLVFGSNWPPCLQAGDYSTAVNIAQSYFSARDPDRTTRIFARNAAAFYRGPRMTQWL